MKNLPNPAMLINWIRKILHPKDHPASQPISHSALSNSRLQLSNVEWVEGEKLLNDFVIEGIVGEGGMGKVYLVRSCSTGTKFALKRAKGLNGSTRMNFLAELQTWIDLPQHSNLVPCRFFRTVNAEVLIFAEYVEGGSLRDWIDSKKLYEGGPNQTLELILNIAIQFAWGLHCVHEHGTVHQDVKPGNVLIGSDAVLGIRPQITDFGLAKAKAADGIFHAGDLKRSILVSTGGGTPAYWSPEQSQGLALTRKTDIWSWAVSVLEMFVGEITWMSGLSAASAIEQYIQEDRMDTAIPAMPDQLADLLRQCFLHDPLDRPASLAEVVEKMISIYRNSIGVEYVPSLDAIEGSSCSLFGIKERLITRGGSAIRSGNTTSPQHDNGKKSTAASASRFWLERVLRITGRDPADAGKIVDRQSKTRRGELVAELMAFDEAKRMYEDLIFSGRSDLRSDLASLCMHKALIHSASGDLNGELQDYNQAILIRDAIVQQNSNFKCSNLLAESYTNRGNTLSRMGNNNAAVLSYEHAIEILERVTKTDKSYKILNNLASCYSNKAAVVRALGDKQQAMTLYNQAITIQECLVHKDGRGELAGDLARTYLNKALVVRSLGDVSGALVLQEMAIEIFRVSVFTRGCGELALELAEAYNNKANLVSAAGDYTESINICDEASALVERLINDEGRREIVDTLARIYTTKANAVSLLGNKNEAVRIYDQAIVIREHLVNQEGRTDLAESLADVYYSKAIAVDGIGDKSEAVALYDQVIAIRERLVNQDGRIDLRSGLAKAFSNKAIIVGELGDLHEATATFGIVVSILERLVDFDGRRDLAQDLIMAYINLGMTLEWRGDKAAATVQFDKAIAVRERMPDEKYSVICEDGLDALRNKATSLDKSI